MSFAISATVAAVATVGSVVSAEKSRKAQKRANRAQNRIRQVEEARSKMAAVREQRIAQSQILNAGGAQNMLGSSAVQGATSAVGSATAGNMQFINQVSNLQESQARYMGRAQMFATRAGQLNSVANLAITAAQFAPEISAAFKSSEGDK